MNTGNKNKAAALGMPYGTANNQLRKMLLFDMATRLDEVWCYRCSYRITKLEEFSIEHTVPWLGAENPKETFFDITKIKFSHLSCNSRAGLKRFGFSKGHTQSRIPVGKNRAWCSKCGEQPVENFTSNKHRWNGLQDLCKSCRAIYRGK